MTSIVAKLFPKLLPKVVTLPVSRTVGPLSSSFRHHSGTGLVKNCSHVTVLRTASNHNSASVSNPFLTAHLQERKLCSRKQLFQSLARTFGTKTNFFDSNVHFLELRYCSRRRLDLRQKFGSESGSLSNEDTLSLSSPSIRAYLRHLVAEHRHINQQLNDEQNVADGRMQKRLRRRLNELTPLVEKVEEWTNKQAEMTEIEKLISATCTNAQDQEMKDLAISEKEECLENAEVLEKQILGLLAPPDKTDDSDIIMEFSTGVGGQEAMLFTANMFEMYRRFAAYKNWGFEKLEYFPTELGGLRHATVSISGEEAYKLMKYEAGVHRVQRVPKTEKSGRIHTSTMTIAVLPQPTEIDLKLDPKDLRIETKKASGAGGQHVNTTDSAVRIVHLPTGITAESQQERSQIRNRIIAMTMLQAKIYSAILEKREAAERSARRSQVGSAGRSEKIRTYNFQQDRVTDHRVGQSVFDVEGFLSGGERLDEMIFSLVREEEVEAITRLVEDFVESQKEDIRK